MLSAFVRKFEFLQLPVENGGDTSFRSRVFSFSDVWPADWEPTNITCQALYDQRIVRGTRQGYLESASFLNLFGKSDSSMAAHVGAVSCILVVDRIIVTGGEDCTVRVWNGDLCNLFTMRQHITPIRKLLATPTDNRVISVSQDNAITVLSLEPPGVLFFFPSFSSKPSSLSVNRDHIFVTYDNGILHAWDTLSGRLVQRTSGERAKLLLSVCSSHIYFDERRSLHHENCQKASITMFPFDTSHVFMVNIKRAMGTTDHGLNLALFAALLVTGIDSELDGYLELPSQHVSIGIRGVNGCLSLIAHPKSEWFQVSPSVTATKLLCLYMVARNLYVVNHRADDEFRAAFVRFLDKLPEATGPKFCYSSLALLSRYWHGSSPELMDGARTLLRWTIRVMPAAIRETVVQYWFQHMPSERRGSTEDPLSKTMSRATVILAIVGCDIKSLLGEEMKRSVALSLSLLANNESPNLLVYRLSAIELLGRGFSIWQGFVNAAAVVRTLAICSIVQNPALVSEMARRTLHVIGMGNATLLVQTILNDIEHARTGSEKNTMLRVLQGFVARDPEMLRLAVPRIIESMLRGLDPAAPHAERDRGALFQQITTTLFDMIKRYPSLAISLSLQRLAAGTEQGVVVVWDLRAATKLHTLDGHTAAVNAVEFSQDGKTIVSYSIKENLIKIWQQPSGILFFMSQSLRSNRSIHHVSSTTQPLSLKLHMKSANIIEISDDTSSISYKL